MVRQPCYTFKAGPFTLDIRKIHDRRSPATIPFERSNIDSQVAKLVGIRIKLEKWYIMMGGICPAKGTQSAEYVRGVVRKQDKGETLEFCVTRPIDKLHRCCMGFIVNYFGYGQMI